MEITESMKESFRERLKKIISKKIETTMIYPLSQFEMVFGDLWGNGLPEESLTDEQLVYREKWKQCRTNVLNLGNQQVRNAKSELDMYDVVWNRYNATFLPPKIG